MKWVLQITGIVFFTFLIVGRPDSGEAKDNSFKKVGKGIYGEHCRVCHGDNGDGKTFVANVLNPPPRNFKNPLIIDSLSREQMVYSVTNGRPGSGMMPWRLNLSKKEIEAVVGYIRSEFMQR